jgi:cell division transport system permease protein
MNWLRCAIRQALRGIRSGVIIQLASIGTIAAGLLLLGLALLTTVNLDRLTKRWGRGIQIVIYFKAEASASRIKAIAHVLEQRPEVLSVQMITSEKAYHRLAESLGGRESLLAGVEKEFLPSSLEISLNAHLPHQVRPLLAFLRSSSVVEEVDYLGTWVERLNSIINLLRVAGLSLALLIGLTSIYIISSTIRLGVFARREEIEILKLVGATDRFIKAPFMLEGAIQGLFGALTALLLLYLTFRLAAPRIEQVLAAALSHMQLGFLSPWYLAAIILGGMLLGFLGSNMALRRYLDI